MKHFIELTSIHGESILIPVNTIIQVINRSMFPKRDLEAYPELNERHEWTTIIQMCNPVDIYVQEPYKSVKKKLEASFKNSPLFDCKTKTGDKEE